VGFGARTNRRVTQRIIHDLKRRNERWRGPAVDAREPWLLGALKSWSSRLRGARRLRRSAMMD